MPTLVIGLLLMLVGAVITGAGLDTIVMMLLAPIWLVVLVGLLWIGLVLVYAVLCGIVLLLGDKA